MSAVGRSATHVERTVYSASTIKTIGSLSVLYLKSELMKNLKKNSKKKGEKQTENRK